MLSGWAGFAIVCYSPPRRGPSEPSPGGRFPRCLLAEVGHRRPFFRRHVVVLLCGWDVAAPRGRRGPSGARESPLFWGGCYNQEIFKHPKKRHDHLSVVYNKDTYLFYLFKTNTRYVISQNDFFIKHPTSSRGFLLPYLAV